MSRPRSFLMAVANVTLIIYGATLTYINTCLQLR